jgi:hypothetical protein
MADYSRDVMKAEQRQATALENIHKALLRIDKTLQKLVPEVTDEAVEDEENIEGHRVRVLSGPRAGQHGTVIHDYGDAIQVDMEETSEFISFRSYEVEES